MKTIDMWAPFWPTPEMTDGFAERFPHEMLGYLRVFFKREPTAAELPDLFEARAMPEDAVVQALDAAGVTRSLVTGFDEHGSVGKTFIPNEMVAALYERQPMRVIPFAGADVMAGMRAVRSFRRWVSEHRFKGLSLRPFMIGLPPSDRRYYPLYTACCEMDVPVSIHASANWTRMQASDLGHPRHLDTVAADFPELKIIASHAGYPWVLEAAMLAWKHPHLYLELAAHRPKYMSRAGTGWEPLFRFGSTTIQDKILYGSGWMLLGAPPAQLLEEVAAWPLDETIRTKWLHDNAAGLLGEA